MKLKNNKFNNGFIYEIFDLLIFFLKHFNLVEYFKLIAEKLTPVDRNKQQYINEIIKNKNTAIDVYIILKWVLLLLFFVLPKYDIITILVFYLIFFNLYTYFYYHIWDEYTLTKKSTNKRNKRRFISTLQSIFYSVLAYTYLYSVPFINNFKWDLNISNFINSFHFSVSNTLLGASNVYPINNLGFLLIISQYFITFLFVTIILSMCFPLYKEGEN